jgi:alkyl hydroperoxide reductase subunit AhpF
MSKPHPGGVSKGVEMADLLNDDIRKQVREAFEGLREPVQVLFFGSEEQCEYCEDTLKLVEEVTSLSDKLSVQVFDMQADAAIAANYNVSLIPGLVIAGVDEDGPVDYGVRYAGIPSGHEFSSLIQDLILVSGRDSNLSEQTRNLLAGLTEPVMLQVFVTPT